MTITTGQGVPVAANETATTTEDALVTIDLTQGSSGNPTAAQLVGTPVGGTVTGFPSTTVTFTPDPDFYGPASFQFTLSNASGTSNTATANITVSPVAIAANLGSNGPDTLCANPLFGDPINTGTGNLYQTEVDFACAPQIGLGLTRYYNSQDTTHSAFGNNWHSTWNRVLKMAGNAVTAIRADGHEDAFTQNSSGVWVPQPNVTSTLTPVMNGTTLVGWTLILADDTVEGYSPVGQLLSVTTRAGLTTTLAYDTKCHLVTVTGPFGNVMSFTYDASNRVSTMTAPDGGVYTYAYDANNNLISVTYPNATVRQYVYGNTSFPNAMTGIIDEDGNLFASFAYDTQGRAVAAQHAGGAELATITYNSDGSTTATDANGNSHTYGYAVQFGRVVPVSLAGAPDPTVGGQAFTYDTNGFLASKTDYDGNVTTYTHDARGDETSRTEAYGTPLARTTSTSWLSNFHLPNQIVEPTGRVTTFAYDAYGNMLSKTVTAASLTRSWLYTYDMAGQVLTASDPLGYVTSYTYDAHGDLASATDALGHTTLFTAYDGAGRLLSSTDPNGLVTNLAYDVRGRLLQRNVGGEITAYSYDAAGNLVKTTRPDASFIAYTYDAAHRLVRAFDALNNQVVFALDGNDNRTNVSLYDPSANLTQTRSFAYDWVNRLIKETGAAGQVTGYSYDPEGNLTGTSDPLNDSTNFFYDALNRRIQTTNAANGVTQYAFDPLDRLTAEADPRNLVASFAYDGLDDQIGIASPDTGTSVKTYDAAGNVLTSTDARGDKTVYSHDALNRVTKALYADGTSTVYDYDQGENGIGHLTKMVDTAGTTGFAYDTHGRLIKKTQTVEGVTLTTEQSYDDAGRLAQIMYPSGKVVQLTYDAAGQVNGLAENKAWLIANVSYRPFGSASTWLEGNGAALVRSFDQDGRMTGVQLGAITKDEITRQLVYSYDPASRITGLLETGEPEQSFGYDALDRLTGFTKGTGKDAETTSYTYDADGNRIGVTEASLSPHRAASTTSYGIAANSNRLTSLDREHEAKENLTYDAAGNMLADSRHEWAYDARGRMESVRDGGGTTDYAINGLGQRIEKRKGADEKQYVYDQSGHLLGEYDTRGNVLEETVYLGNLPVAVMVGHEEGRDWDRGHDRDDSAIYYIAADNLGAPHIITKQNGQEIWSWHHDPFGTTPPKTTIFQSDILTFGLRFPGQIFDQESGLDYNMFRDYNPRLGRYVQSDPIGLVGGSYSTYAYVGNNPLLYSDELGLLNWVERQAVPENVVNNTKTVINRVCGGGLTPDQVNQLIDEVLHNISIHDAPQFSSINPNSSPVTLSPQQNDILQNQIDQISDPILKQTVTQLYNNSKANQNVIIK